MSWPIVADLTLKTSVAVITAVVAFIATETVKSRYKIVQLTARTHPKYYQQFAELYSERIEDDQQVSPLVIGEHAADKRVSPTTARHLRAAATTAGEDDPLRYQVFLAVRRKQVIGFISVCVNLPRTYAFISYLGIRQGPDMPGNITRRLLDAVLGRLSGLPGRWLFLFEVAPPSAESTRTRAKVRLFATYGQPLRMVTRRVPVTYVQPDMDFEALDGQSEEVAELYVSAPADVVGALSRQDHLDLVHSVYSHIYLRSCLEPDLQPPYAAYLSSLYGTVAKSYCEPAAEAVRVSLPATPREAPEPAT